MNEQQERGMNWTKRVALIVLVLAMGVGGFMWLVRPPREPSYQGKTLSEWLADYNDAGEAEDTNAQEECRDAIRHIGTNAIPPLLRILKAKDSAAKIKIMELLERQDFIRIPISSVEEEKWKLISGFHLLGQMATNAAPALIDIYAHPPSSDSQDIANQVLMSLYPAPCVAIPYWVPSGDRSEWYRAAGITKLQDRAPADAISAFSQAIILAPSDARAYFDRSRVKIQLQDFKGALADLTKAIELPPRDDEAVFLKGVCEYSLKDFNSAEADFTTVINLDTNDTRAYNYRGLAKANRREWDAALADFNQVIKVATNNAEAYRNRALVEAQQKEYELALADASRSIWLDPHDPNAYLIRGRIKSGLKDYPSAVADYDKAITLNPKDSTVYSARGLARVMLDDFDNAAADLEKALELNPRNVMAIMVNGLLKAKRGQDEEALADFQRAVELAPQMPEPCGLLGLFQYKNSQWEPALANFHKSLNLGATADVGEMHAYMWLIRTQSEEKDAANEELEAYLKSPDGAKTNEWGNITARFFLGNLPERDFRDLATTSAKRPGDVRTQVCESLYYDGMKRKIAGDKTGAAELFQKCLDTKYDNSIAYLNAGVEMRALKQP
jgi:tetratricopeptide (TPR) repeat protein